MSHTDERDRLPAYYQGKLAGERDMLWDALWRDFAWLMSCDGRLMTSKEIDALTAIEAEGPQPPDYRSPWSRIDGEQSRHVWKDANGLPDLERPIGARFRPWYAAQIASVCPTIEGKPCRRFGPSPAGPDCV